MPQAAIACRSPATPRCKARPPRKFYRPRDHEASPFFKIVRERFDEFERVYPERYQQRYGYWRPVIRSSIDKFLKCGDLKKGFARVKCKDCGEEYFVAFSCRQRSCCPACMNGFSRFRSGCGFTFAMTGSCLGPAILQVCCKITMQNYNTVVILH